MSLSSQGNHGADGPQFPRRRKDGNPLAQDSTPQRLAVVTQQRNQRETHSLGPEGIGQLSPLRSALSAAAGRQLVSPVRALAMQSAGMFSPRSWHDEDVFASAGFLAQQLLEEQLAKTPSPRTHVKGRCWACWEVDEEFDDPLIRTCLGCKDRDLQWIHQSCINSFINNLPDVDTLRDNALVRAAADNDENPRLACPQMRCTRCGDPYRITYLEIHPVVILWADRLLRYALLLLLAALAVSTGCSLVLLWRYYNRPVGAAPLMVPLPLFKYQLPVHHVALGILAFCHTVNYLTWHNVWRFASRNYRKHVHAVD